MIAKAAYIKNANVKITLSQHYFWGDIVYFFLFTNNIYHCFKYYISHIFFIAEINILHLKKGIKTKIVRWLLMSRIHLT